MRRSPRSSLILDNFRDLGAAVAEAAGDVAETMLFPCGLARGETGIRQFSAGGGAAARFDSGGRYSTFKWWL